MEDAVPNATSLASPRQTIGGWPLFWFNAFWLTLIMIVLAGQHGFDIEGVRIVVRTTAQTSLALFSTAFVASSLYALAPSGPTRWLLANRRYFGVSFAYSHFLHAVALYAFAKLDPATFATQASPAMFIFGGIAYGFIVLMTLTSFDTTAALIGRRAWTVLHTLGAYDIWLTFLVAEGRRALNDSYYWPYIGVLFAVMALRLLAMSAKRRAGAMIGSTNNIAARRGTAAARASLRV
jgi:sulfoxide reductase heme-binding subunit YedZ